MPLSLVRSQIGLTGTARYEELWNELAGFIDEKAGGVDEKALRIILSSIYLHRFTKELPISLWLHGCPKWLTQTLVSCMDREVNGSPPGFLAAFARSTVKPAVWVYRYPDLAFKNLRYSRRQIDTIRGIITGHLEWAPHRTRVDGINPELAPTFVWKGRVTMIACGPLALTPTEEHVRSETWPAVENHFVEVRVAHPGEFSPREVELRQSAIGDAPQIGRMVQNLLDQDFRESNAARRPIGLFDHELWMTRIAAAFRGPSFDAEDLGAKAMRLAMAHANLMAKTEADDEDASLARKVITDAIPRSKWKVARAIPIDGHFTPLHIEKITSIHTNTCRPILNDLVGAGCLKRVKGEKVEMLRVEPEFQKALMAGL